MLSFAQKVAIEYFKVHIAESMQSNTSKYTLPKVHIAQKYAIEWITLAGIYKSMNHTSGDL